MEFIKRGNNVDFIVSFDPQTALVTNISSAVLSVRNDVNQIDIPLSDLTVSTQENKIIYSFSQEQTLAFKANSKVRIELAVLMNDKRQCVVRKEYGVLDALYNEVLV